MKIKQSIQQHHHNNSLDTYQNFTRWKALPLSSSVSIDRPGVCVRLGRSDRFLWDRSFLGDDLLKNQFQMKSYWFQCELCSDTRKIPFSNGYPLHLKTYIKQLTTTTPTNLCIVWMAGQDGRLANDLMHSTECRLIITCLYDLSYFMIMK